MKGSAQTMGWPGAGAGRVIGWARAGSMARDSSTATANRTYPTRFTAEAPRFCRTMRILAWVTGWRHWLVPHREAMAARVLLHTAGSRPIPEPGNHPGGTAPGAGSRTEPPSPARVRLAASVAASKAKAGAVVLATAARSKPMRWTPAWNAVT